MIIYNFSTIEFNIIFYFLVALFCLYEFVKCFLKKDSEWLYLIIVIVTLILSGNELYKNINSIKSPEVVVYEGFYTNCYVNDNLYYFKNEKDEKSYGFYMTQSSKKEIYSDDFQKDEKYKIYYDSDTDVIMKIEKLE